MMQRSDVFKIRFKHGLKTRGTGVSPRPAVTPGEGVDFSRIRDVVDIVVGGTSISTRAEEDSIFFLVRDLLYAVETLAEGDGVKRVSFHKGPWELVLQRLGAVVYITFYRGGLRPHIVVKDRAVAFEHLLEGVLASADDLEYFAQGLDSNAMDDPLIADIRAVHQRLCGLSNTGEPRPSRPADRPTTLMSTRWMNPRSEKSFSFGFKFAAGVTDLLVPGKPQGNDLYALLFPGRFVMHLRGSRIVLGEGYLFLQTECLLLSVRKLLEAWEEGRPMNARLVSEGLAVGVRLGRDDGLKIRLMDSTREDAVTVLNDISPWEYADAVLGVARELWRLIVQANPAQRRNLRLEVFGREIKSLAAWVKEQRQADVINPDAERYRHMVERQVISSPVLIGRASRLSFREKWRVEVEGLRLDSTVLSGNLLLAETGDSLLGLETESGALIWRRDIDHTDARMQLVGSEYLARATLSGQIELVDLTCGVLRWSASLEPRSGGAPVLLVADQGPAPGVIVTAERERRLVAIDVRTGELRWRFTASRGGRFALRRYGRLLYVVSSDSHFNAVDIETGSLVWRFAGRTRFVSPPAVTGDTLLITGGPARKPGGKLYAFDAFSGEPKWEVSLGGGAVTEPLLAGGCALVPVHKGDRSELFAIDADTGRELWRKDCEGWADSCALMALDDGFVINSAGGVVRFVGGQDGQERWCTVLGPSFSDDVPVSLKVVLRGGVLFVPSDTVYLVHPEDGKLIHSLGPDSPVPDYLQVDQSCSVLAAEQSGHMAMFALASRLSVV